MLNFHRCFLSGGMLLFLFGCGIPALIPTPLPTRAPELPAATLTETPIPPSPSPAPTPSPSPSPTLVPPTRVPTATLAPLGDLQSITTRFVFLGDRGEAALGFNMQAGGAIARLRYRGTEYLDTADFGRYIQFSPYDGDDTYLCDASSCYLDWGWNPVQAGSHDRIPAQVHELRTWADGLYIKAAGQEWGRNKPGSDVIYETWAWDRHGYFEIHLRMTHVNWDTHAAAGAEAPAAYFSSAIPVGYGYSGPAPFTGEPIQEYRRVSGHQEKNLHPYLSPSEHWLAFGNELGEGVILAVPPQPKLTHEWSMVYITSDSQAGVGYLSPRAYFETTPFMTYDLTYYLIPGLIAKNRAIVYDLIPHTNWTFDLGTTEGWRDPDGSARASESALQVNISPANPLSSRPDLNFYGVQAPVVTMETQIQSGEAELCLSFITLDDPVWDAQKSSCRHTGAEGIQAYRFDFSSNGKWMNGLVTQLQLTGSAPISLEIGGMAARRDAFGWEFGNAPDTDGWYAVKQLDPLVTSAGSLAGRIRGANPYMRSPLINLPARHTQIEIRMKIEPASVSVFKVYFVTEGDPHWDETKVVRFPVTADGEYHVYQVDMSAAPGWQGQIRQLRLDPKESAGGFEIDYIRLRAP